MGKRRPKKVQVQSVDLKEQIIHDIYGVPPPPPPPQSKASKKKARVKASMSAKQFQPKAASIEHVRRTESETWKLAGNGAYWRQEYEGAVCHYTQAIGELVYEYQVPRSQAFM